MVRGRIGEVWLISFGPWRPAVAAIDLERVVFGELSDQLPPSLHPLSLLILLIINVPSSLPAYHVSHGSHNYHALMHLILSNLSYLSCFSSSHTSHSLNDGDDADVDDDDDDSGSDDVDDDGCLRSSGLEISACSRHVSLVGKRRRR